MKEVTLPKLFYCAPGIHTALRTMAAQQVRRLPVLLSLDDIVPFAEEKAGELIYFEVVETLKAICEHTTTFQSPGCNAVICSAPLP